MQLGPSIDCPTAADIPELLAALAALSPLEGGGGAAAAAAAPPSPPPGDADAPALALRDKACIAAVALWQLASSGTGDDGRASPARAIVAQQGLPIIARALLELTPSGADGWAWLPLPGEARVRARGGMGHGEGPIARPGDPAWGLFIYLLDP